MSLSLYPTEVLCFVPDCIFKGGEGIKFFNFPTDLNLLFQWFNLCSNDSVVAKEIEKRVITLNHKPSRYMLKLC